LFEAAGLSAIEEVRDVEFGLCPPPDGHLSTREPPVERNVDKLVDITPSGRRHRLLPFAPDA
jgi:hypothetical protein